MRPLRLFLVLALLAGCSPRHADAPRDLKAGQTVRQVRIYLISIEKGKPCGGSAAPVEVELPAPSPALAGSLDALLDAGKRHESAGFYNALAGSPLKVRRIELARGSARVDLAGYLEIGGECDGSRALEQLRRTATQFSDVRRADFFLEGKPLRDLLAGK